MQNDINVVTDSKWRERLADPKKRHESRYRSIDVNVVTDSK